METRRERPWRSSNFFQKYQASIDALPQGITGKEYLLYLLYVPLLHDLANAQQGEGYSVAHITRCLQLAELRYTSDPVRRAKGQKGQTGGSCGPIQRGLWRACSRDARSLLAYMQAHPGEARQETLLAWKLRERLLADKEAQSITASHQGFCYLLKLSRPWAMYVHRAKDWRGRGDKRGLRRCGGSHRSGSRQGLRSRSIFLDCWRSAPATSVCGPSG